MRVAHCVGWYAPDSLGGSEIYVESLARALRVHGVESVVLAPRDGDVESRYVHEGTEVVRYPVPADRDGRQQDGERPHRAFERFQSLLADTGADVFHLHSITYGANAHHLACARTLGMAAVTTLHLGAPLCERGSLLRYGREPCDGRIDPRQCVPCWLEGKGLRESIARPLGRLLRGLPAPLGARAPGRAGTLLSAHSRISRRREALVRVAAQSHRIVAVCDWIHAALRANGIEADKLVRCGQGIDPPDASHWGPRADLRDDGVLRVAFFGRSEPVKGLDLLVDAVRDLPTTTRLRLTVYAIANLSDERRHLETLRARAAGDARIVFAAPVPVHDVREEIRRHDVIAVPSRVLETGPRIVLESLAAGVPVLGSDLGGVRELVVPGRHGWLLPHDDVRCWRDTLERLARELPRLTWSPADLSLLTHDDVAKRHAVLYREAIA